MVPVWAGTYRVTDLEGVSLEGPLTFFKVRGQTMVRVDTENGPVLTPMDRIYEVELLTSDQ